MKNYKKSKTPSKEVIKTKNLTKEELFKLNKKEQIQILEDFGVKKIPKLEKDRVDFILKIQKQIK